MPSYRHKRRRGAETPVMGRRPKNQSNSTPGHTKSASCQATNFERVFCKRNRSYKYDGYNEWLGRTRRG